MIARNETIFKWSLYAAATALCLLVQTGFLQRLEFWGALPFLYPLLAAIPATSEGPRAGSIFSLCVGLVSDLLLPGPVPCLYTLIFPLAGLCAGLLSQSWLPAGFLCSFVSAAAAFLLHGSFRRLGGRSPGHGPGVLRSRSLRHSADAALPLRLPKNPFRRLISK